MTPESTTGLSATAKATLLAGWAFVLAKVLVIGNMLGGAWGLQFLPAVVSAFGADGVVLLALAAAGLVGERLMRRPAPSWLPYAVGGVVGLYALLNVFLVVEIGRPVTVDMLQIGVGTGEAGAMLLSTGGILALCGVILYAVTAVPLLRWLGRHRRGVGTEALFGLAVYSAFAVGFVEAWPRVASLYGLHRNAVAELALSALPDTSLFAYAHTSPAELTHMDFPVPEGDGWTAPVRYDASNRPKHVVLWFGESTGARYTSLFDERMESTPNLLRLQQHSLRFDRYYANSPLSEKAFFGILCGMYPYPSRRAMASVNPRIACPSLMETLSERGYRTGFFTGALFGFGDKQKFLAERGFDTMIDGESVPNRDRYWHNGWGIDDAAIVDEALRWLDARPDPDQPQLTVMVPIIPHVPYATPPDTPRPHGRGSAQSRYLDALHYADSQFGRFYDAYVERGLADDTLFVYVGDHGEAFEQHPGNVDHASFIYDENLHVPLLFINPRLFPTEVVSERLGSHVDLTPTLLDLLGQPSPPGETGQSLVADDYRYRPVFVGAFMRDRLGGLQDGNLKYIYNFETGFEEVYDLSVDPMETDNLVDRFEVGQVATWRSWVIEQQAHQAAFLETYPKIGPSYLARSLDHVKVFLEDGDQRVACTSVLRPGVLGCPDTPHEVAIGLQRERIRSFPRECLTVHAPPHGAMVVEFSSLDTPPGLIGAGLLDKARAAGGTPLHVTWHIADLDPIEMTLDDAREHGWISTRVPPVPDVPGGVSVRVEIRSDDWHNREGCLILSP